MIAFPAAPHSSGFFGTPYQQVAYTLLCLAHKRTSPKAPNIVSESNSLILIGKVMPHDQVNVMDKKTSSGWKNSKVMLEMSVDADVRGIHGHCKIYCGTISHPAINDAYSSYMKIMLIHGFAIASPV